MKVAIDLEGTLVAECGEFACEHTPRIVRRVLPLSLRIGARELLGELARAGHTLTLYTSGTHTKRSLRLWCLLNGLPIRQIITVGQCTKKVPGKEPLVVWPPVQGQELILDDNPLHLEAAERQGVPGLHITNVSSDWTQPIRQACLQQPI